MTVLLKRGWRGWVVAPVLACSVIVGCGDDEGGDDDPMDELDGGDGGFGADADANVPFMPVDAGMDATTPMDASGQDADTSDAGSADAAPPLPPQLPAALAKLAPLSPTDNDRLFSVAFGADNKIYAAGYLQATAGGVTDRKMAVARFGVDGELDTTFGDAVSGGSLRTGYATINLNVASADEADTIETARALAFQSDGTILVAGNVPRGKIALGSEQVDQVDIAVVRLTAAGALDTSYSAADIDGVAGAAIVSLGATVQHTTTNAMGMATTATINDDVYGVSVDASDRALVFARAKAEAERTDYDRFVVRFTSSGALDTAFAGDGKYSYDVSGQGLNDNARNGIALAGGKILAAGYTNIGGKNNVALLRLNEDGTEDTSFGEGGKLTTNPLAPMGMAEAYGVALQSTGNYVTVGYGNGGTPPQKLLSFRFTPAGGLDPSYGTQGNVLIDVQADSDQGRAIVALPDDRLLAVGNSNSAMGVQDALVVLLTKDGELDRSFNASGAKAYDLGRASEQLLSVALSPDGQYAAAVGHSIVADGPEDAALWIQKLRD